MKCPTCGGAGFYDTYFGGGASYTPSIAQCPKRCNLTGYSNEVQRRLNDKTRFTAHRVLPAKPSQRAAAKVLKFPVGKMFHVERDASETCQEKGDGTEKIVPSPTPY